MRYVLILLAATLSAQDGTTNAGVHRSSLLLRSGKLPDPSEIRVYDFMNYHTHAEIAEPRAEDRVTLDARLFRSALPKGETESTIQIGLRTPPLSKKQMRAMNLAVVIDKSGSMGSERKMDFVKQGLAMLIAQLDEDDVLSIVVYDTEARVLCSAGAVSDPKALIQMVDSIQPGGSTNLHGGMMLGFREVEKNLDGRRFPKVLLLSDGMANVGVTEPEQVVAQAKPYFDKGVALSTIGIGLSYNDALMSQLAKSGNGTYHFLDSADAIERAFIKELKGLLQPVGRDPRLTVRLRPGVALKKALGGEFSNPETGVYEFALLDLPVESSQILLLDVGVGADASVLASVELSYIDTLTNAPAIKKVELKADRSDAGQTDAAVLKNLAIARMAEAFREACGLADRTAAHDRVSDALTKARTVYGSEVKDADLKRMFTLLKEAADITKP